MIKFSVGLMLISLVISCDSRELWRDGIYIVSWVDTEDNTALGFDLGDGNSIGRVGKNLLSVGSNPIYIIAKQSVDGKVAYYIINRAKDKPEAILSNVRLGPYTKEEFDVKRKELELPEFTWFSK